MKSKINHQRVVEWCSKEVTRQHAGPISVWHMYQAWDAALREGPRFWAGLPMAVSERIEWLGKLVEPNKNLQGYRNCYLSFPRDTPGPTAVPYAMEEWCGNVATLRRGFDVLSKMGDRVKLRKMASGWTRRFLKIHPFADGNGRTAAIIFNMLMDSMEEPITLPDFFGEVHRHKV